MTKKELKTCFIDKLYVYCQHDNKTRRKLVDRALYITLIIALSFSLYTVLYPVQITGYQRPFILEFMRMLLIFLNAFSLGLLVCGLVGDING